MFPSLAVILHDLYPAFGVLAVPFFLAPIAGLASIPFMLRHRADGGTRTGVIILGVSLILAVAAAFVPMHEEFPPFFGALAAGAYVFIYPLAMMGLGDSAAFAVGVGAVTAGWLAVWWWVWRGIKKVAWR